MRRWLAHDYPLEGFMCQLVLPRDLTEAEAAKIAAFVKALAMPTYNR